MKYENIIKELSKTKIDKSYVDSIEEYYGMKIPEDILKLLSIGKKTPFIDNVRIVSTKEIIESNVFLGVDCKTKGIVPLIDVFDNDFIIYSIKEKCYYIYNIVDDVLFDKKANLSDYSEKEID